MPRNPIVGTRDRFGSAMRKHDMVSTLFSQFVRSRGYEQLRVPVLEHVSSFAEEVVGQSPWPEWNERGCFYLELPSFGDSYSDTRDSEPALLIPEGTVSVSRWLAAQLTDERLMLPIKVFYELPCFRNEPLESLHAGKLREFTQFGLEILGSANSGSDTEVVLLVHELLEAAGVPRSSVRLRVNDVGMFIQLISDSGIAHGHAIEIKESLDTIAECRAGKAPGRLEGALAHASEVLSGYDLPEHLREAWEQIMSPSSGRIDHLTAAPFTTGTYAERLAGLRHVQKTVSNVGVTVHIDPCVVRSHEYYTGLSFEVDVLTPNGNHIEVAGGGRYDKLVEHFLADTPLEHTRVPATGFAFGMERLIQVLESTGVFGRNAEHKMTYTFNESTADVLVVPPLQDDRAEGYLTAVAQAAACGAARVSVYVGDNLDAEAAKKYAKAHGIRDIRWC